MRRREFITLLVGGCGVAVQRPRAAADDARSLPAKLAESSRYECLCELT
jgi:hypothetical protein